MTRLHRTAQAAVILGLKPQTLRKWRLSGRGPRYVRVSQTMVAYDEAELTRWADARTFGSTSEETVAKGAK